MPKTCILWASGICFMYHLLINRLLWRCVHNGFSFNKGGYPMDTNSLSHMKWECKYHIMFALKCRRKIAYGELKQDIANILSVLSKRKGAEIIEVKYVRTMCICCWEYPQYKRIEFWRILKRQKYPNDIWTTCKFKV